MSLYDEPGFPHKGWKYVRIEDLGEGLYPGQDILYEQCEVCGFERLRYVHVLYHPDYKTEIRVGCECASKLTEDYINPQENERKLKNKTNRRRNFLKKEWRMKESTGNYVMRYKGIYITIIRNKYGPGFGVVVNNRCAWKYNNQQILDLDTAKLAAFELVEYVLDVW